MGHALPMAMVFVSDLIQASQPAWTLQLSSASLLFISYSHTNLVNMTNCLHRCS